MWQNRIRIFTFIIFSLISYVSCPVVAQRIVTPVESNDLPLEIQKKIAAEAAQQAKDSIDVAAKDSANAEKKMAKKDIFGGIMLTADISSPVMNLFGVQYGNYEVALEVDLMHQIFPVVEFGVGYAHYTPEDNNYTYSCEPSFYGRVGFNYNFLYKNGSKSFITVGARYGLSSFSYSWQNISLYDSYWNTQITTDTPRQTALAHWGEVVVALRVQVYKNFYMGFSGRYRIMVGCDSSEYGAPYFVPGFGPKEQAFGFTYVVGYDLPIAKKKKDVKLP